MHSTGGAAYLVTLTCSPSTGTAVTSLASRAVLAPAPTSHALLLGRLSTGWKQDQGPVLNICDFLKSLLSSRMYNCAKAMLD